MAMNTLCLIFAAIVCGAASRGSEEQCFQNGLYGVLKRSDLCESIPKDVKTLSKLKIYGYDGDYSIICCVNIEQDITTRWPVATTQRLTTSTTEYVPEVYDYVTTRPVIDSCAPVNSIAGVSTLEKTGQKAWDKCVEYQEKLVYPCEESVAIMGGLTRYNHCRHGTHGASNNYAKREEYPHMALLGDKRNGTVVWSCSGTLISEKFILIAARCGFRRKRRIRAATSLAMVGSLNGLQNLDKPQTHLVRRIIRHPQFSAPSWYHDIALVETVTTIILDQWTVPACLDVFSGEDSKVVATQWTPGSDEVQTEDLKKLHHSECHLYLRRRKLRMRGGYNSTIQACYGSNSPAVNLQNYIGGPITIKNSRLSCMYDVVGVTSIKQNRRKFTTGIYTRVSNYVPWIENVVWPNTV